MARHVWWLARVLGFDVANPHDGDGVASFERIDGSRMRADEFHLSDSMRLDDANVRDFAETLPAFSHRANAVSTRAPRITILPQH